MLLISFILLILSNTTTTRRDKSTQYLRVTVTILLISAFIAYDNLFLLFLAKGIGIFGGLLYITSTAIYYHIFLLITCCFVLLLTSFHKFNVCHFKLMFFFRSIKNLSMFIILLKILIRVPELYSNIVLYQDFITTFTYTLAYYMEFHFLTKDDFLVSRMNIGDMVNPVTEAPIIAEAPITPEAPIAAKAPVTAEPIISEPVTPEPLITPESPELNDNRKVKYTQTTDYSTGFMPLNPKDAVETLYDENDIKIRTLHYKHVVKGSRILKETYKQEDFDNEGNLVRTELINSSDIN